MQNVKKFGNWNLAGRFINNLKSDIEESNRVTLQRISIKARDTAVKHLRNQDLGWVSLAPETRRRKQNKGLSEKTLIATSSYFQSITAFSTSTHAYAGVKKTAKNKDGEIIADIAKVHEYGSKTRNIPARPLWRPTYKETVRYIRSSGIFAKAFLDRRKKRYGF